MGRKGRAVLAGMVLVAAGSAWAGEREGAREVLRRRAARVQQERQARAPEREVLGRVLLVDVEGLYVMDRGGSITLLAMDGGTRFEGRLRSARDLETGQEVRARYVWRGADGVATRVQRVSGSGEGAE